MLLVPPSARSRVFVVAFCVLLVPGVFVLSQWQTHRLKVVVGLIVGVAIASVILFLLTDLTAFSLSVASWIIEHQVLSALGLLLIVGGTAAAIFLGPRPLQPQYWTARAPVIAVALGAVGGVALSLVFVVGFTWQGRYSYATDVEVPELTYDVGTFVALGDSYAAGEGLTPFITGDSCHRSQTFAFSELLRYQGQPILEPTTSLRACSGARSRQVYDFAQHERFGVQVGEPTLTPNTGLVTIVMGGNDVHFADVLKFCALHRHCLEAPFAIHAAGPDEVTDMAPDALLAQWADSMLTVVDARLENLFTRIRADVGPTTRVLVVGYPHLLPDGRVPRQFNYCDGLMGVYDKEERDGINALQVRLNQTIGVVAARTGIEFVDPTRDFDEHEVCGIRGELIHSTDLKRVDPGMFHPTVKGQRLLAREVVCYLNNHPPQAYGSVPESPATTTAQEMSTKDSSSCPNVERD